MTHEQLYKIIEDNPKEAIKWIVSNLSLDGTALDKIDLLSKVKSATDVVSLRQLVTSLTLDGLLKFEN